MGEVPWKWVDFGAEVSLFGACPQTHADGCAYYLVRSPGDDHCHGAGFDPGFEGKVTLVCGSGVCPGLVSVYVNVPKRKVIWMVPILSESD